MAASEFWKRRERNLIDLLHQFVTQQAQDRAEATAFGCASERLSYGELDVLSSRLAHFLVDQGMQLGDRVGVFMPRDVQTAVSVYGIMKAGGVFVPIDPLLSAGGVAQLVNDCGIRHLLTHPRKMQVVSALCDMDTTLQCLIGASSDFQPAAPVRSFPWSAFNEAPERIQLARSIRSDDPAYIMYSSGSTGRPKGITHTHSSGLAYCQLSVQTYDVRPEDVIANHSPINFDMSTFGYFASCVAGATTVLIPEAYTKLPSSLAQLIEREGISIWYSVPLALIQLLLHARIDTHDMSCLRWIKFGGEPFPPKHLKALMKKWPHASFSNVYGPAEVNQCTFYHVPPEYADQDDDEPVPIGQVWDRTEGMVIDESDAVVAEGAVGELAISSPTMMQGYWGRPEQTERSMLRLGNGQDSQRVFYRTGDLVQQRQDGNLLFLGRKDRQDKVRGYRVELDEIENAITAHEHVEEAGVYCVTVDDSRIIQAAVIARSGSALDEERLKLFLGGVLSPYAIPTQITIVDQLPRTTSGKIDRKRLTQQAEQVNTCQ